MEQVQQHTLTRVHAQASFVPLTLLIEKEKLLSPSYNSQGTR